jgi:hypothetical protein
LGLELRRHRRFIGRPEAVKDVRGGSGQHAFGAEQVLDRDRNAVERPQRGALRTPGIRFGRAFKRELRRLGDEGIE